MRRRDSPASFAGFAIVAAVVGLGIFLGVTSGLFGAFAPRLTAPERGYRLALREGCFNCHGPGGTGGVANAGRDDGDVPGFTGGTPMMYAKSPAEVRQWIAEGITDAQRNSASARAKRAAGALRMPAYGKRLGARDLDDLVAYVRAASQEYLPDDPVLAAGLETGGRLGCFGCHGPMGLGCRRNPNSLRGYIPAWSGDDFAELCRDSVDFRAWVRDGAPARLRDNAVARFFMERPPVHMPAFGDRVNESDLNALWAYIRVVREDSTFAWAR
jgi:mono/diheme cytochrome c family protein